MSASPAWLRCNQIGMPPVGVFNGLGTGMNVRHLISSTSHRRVSVLVLVVGCLAACGGSGVGAADGPVLTSPAGPADGGMDALVLGMVDVRDGCVLLVQEDVPGEPVYPVIWPAGTSWREDPPAVVLAGGQVVESGTSVSGGGGYLQRDGIENLAGSEVTDAAAECAGATARSLCSTSTATSRSDDLVPPDPRVCPT